MGCVLRASGLKFNPQSFLANSSLSASNVFREGEARSELSKWKTSGLTVVVSDAEFDQLEAQVSDALGFLNSHDAEIVRLRNYEGVTDVRLDFAIDRANVFVQSTYLNPELVQHAGRLGVGIELSIYGEQLLPEMGEVKVTPSELWQFRMTFAGIVDAFCKHPKMYTHNGTFGEVIAFLDGFAHGRRLTKYHYTFSPFLEWLRLNYSEDSAELKRLNDRSDDSLALAEFAKLYRQFDEQCNANVEES